MEAVYRWKGDKRILLYEEGNQILAQVIGTGRTVQWGSLCRDYHSCGVSLFWEDEIYVAYVNTENVLMWDKLFAEGRLVLVKGDDWGSISTVRIAPVAGERTQLYVWYRMADPGNGTDSLYVINPLGERKVQRLVYGTERIERYEILQHGEAVSNERVSPVNTYGIPNRFARLVLSVPVSIIRTCGIEIPCR